jgi:DNA-binding response OmpR family regulator
MPATILVVEDEVLVRAVVSDFLRGCGYRVLEAATGEEAEALFLADEPIEILVSDIDLGPGMNGFALASWVRKSFPEVKIILVSGVARMAKETLDLCDGPFLTKPFPLPTLEAHIKRLLAVSGRRTG